MSASDVEGGGGARETIPQRSSSSLKSSQQEAIESSPSTFLTFVHPAFPLPITASQPCKVPLKDGFGGSVVEVSVEVKRPLIKSPIDVYRIRLNR